MSFVWKWMAFEMVAISRSSCFMKIFLRYRYSYTTVSLKTLGLCSFTVLLVRPYICCLYWNSWMHTWSMKLFWLVTPLVKAMFIWDPSSHYQMRVLWLKKDFSFSDYLFEDMLKHEDNPVLHFTREGKSKSKDKSSLSVVIMYHKCIQPYLPNIYI